MEGYEGLLQTGVGLSIIGVALGFFLQMVRSSSATAESNRARADELTQDNADLVRELGKRDARIAELEVKVEYLERELRELEAKLLKLGGG